MKDEPPADGYSRGQAKDKSNFGRVSAPLARALKDKRLNQPCPFCGQHATALMKTRIEVGPQEHIAAYTMCLSCGAQGPVKDNVDDAIHAWLDRPEGQPLKAPLALWLGTAEDDPYSLPGRITFVWDREDRDSIAEQALIQMMEAAGYVHPFRCQRQGKPALEFTNKLALKGRERMLGKYQKAEQHWPEHTMWGRLVYGRARHLFDAAEWGKFAPHRTMCHKTGAISSGLARPYMKRCPVCKEIELVHEALLQGEHIEWFRVHRGRVLHASVGVTQGPAPFTETVAVCGAAGLQAKGPTDKYGRCKLCTLIVKEAERSPAPGEDD